MSNRATCQLWCFTWMTFLILVVFTETIKTFRFWVNPLIYLRKLNATTASTPYTLFWTTMSTATPNFTLSLNRDLIKAELVCYRRKWKSPHPPPAACKQTECTWWTWRSIKSSWQTSGLRSSSNQTSRCWDLPTWSTRKWKQCLSLSCRPTSTLTFHRLLSWIKTPLTFLALTLISTTTLG